MAGSCLFFLYISDFILLNGSFFDGRLTAPWNSEAEKKIKFLILEPDLYFFISLFFLQFYESQEVLYFVLEIQF